MKTTNYDILEVSSKASKEVIDAAYQKLRSQLLEAAGSGDDDARNRLVILQEAYATVSSPEKRAAYDATLGPVKPAGSNQPPTYAYASNGTLEESWFDSKMVKLVIGVGIATALYSAYKFMGNHGTPAVQSKQVEIQARQVDMQSAVAVGQARNDERRPESEPVAAQSQDSRVQIDYRDSAAAQRAEVERQRLELERQRQQWAQEQFEKDRARAEEQRVRNEAERVHQRNKRQLCDIYRSNGQYAQARQEGC